MSKITEILVNNNSVKVEGPKVTGLEIKKAAIDQGVTIKADFQLTQMLANGERQVIGNDDTVTINKNSKFTAVSSDDNS